MRNKLATVSKYDLQLAADVVYETPAIIGYIDNELFYRFANKAYLDWFGKTSEQVIGRHMLDVLGKVYYENLPHTMAVLSGMQQIFERKFSLPTGHNRYGLVTYKPHEVRGGIKGFFVLVVDVSTLKDVQFSLIEAKKHFEVLAQREVDILNKSNRLLERLCLMGQAITSFLEFGSICCILKEYINELLGEWLVEVYVLDAKENKLSRVDRRPEGSSDVTSITSDELNFDVISQCIELNEIILQDNNHYFISGIEEELTILACPMYVGSLVVGAVKLKTFKFRELDKNFNSILRMLCGYAASAFRNSMIHTDVKNAQDILVEQEKMKALSSIVNGVAHKINTPLGNCIMSTSILHEKNEMVSLSLENGSLNRSELDSYVKMTRTALGVLDKNLQQTSALVDNFKNIVSTSAGESAVLFDLYECCVQFLEFVNVSDQYVLEFNFTQQVKMVSYPNALGSVLQALGYNAIQHAFEGRNSGIIYISACLVLENFVHITFSDNGVGVSKCILGSIFDPFFTTKMSSAGGGLGLSKVYFLVKKVLMGDITVKSELGVGTSFSIKIPINVSR
jgi:PAS domain S-box-containing protein